MTDVNQDLYNYFSDDVAIWLMCFIGGFMDAAGYVKLRRLFVASVTGNLIVAAASIYRPYYDVLVRVYVLLAFVFGVLMSTYIAIQLRVVEEWSMRQCAVILKCLEIALILTGFAVGLEYNNEIDNAASLNDWHIKVVGCVLAVAMGVHIGSLKNCMPHSPLTAVMTTNLVTVCMNAVVYLNYILARHSLIKMRPRKRDPRNGTAQHKELVMEKFNFTGKKLLHSAYPLVCFMIGAIIGSVCMYGLAFWSLIIPVFILALLTVDMHIGSKQKPPSRRPSRAALHEEVVVTEDEEEARSTMRELDSELRRDEDVLIAAEDISHHEKREVEISAF